MRTAPPHVASEQPSFCSTGGELLKVKLSSDLVGGVGLVLSSIALLCHTGVCSLDGGQDFQRQHVVAHPLPGNNFSTNLQLPRFAYLEFCLGIGMSKFSEMSICNI